MSNSISDQNGYVYVRVREELREQIYTLDEGAKLPSERELSERFCVDRATVRRAMRDLQDEGYVVRYHGKGTFARKIPKISSSENQSKVIGLVVGNAVVPFSERILEGVESLAAADGYSVLLCNSLLSNEREKQHLESLSQLNVSRILVAPFAYDSNDLEYADLILRLKNRGARIVMVDYHIPELDLHSVNTDKVQIGYTAAEHLIMQGHKRICYACSGSFDRSGRDCLRGYRMALEDYGIEFSRDLVIDISSVHCATPTHDAVIEMLTENPRAFTAIATPFFSMTHGIIKALNELGKRMPEDIALVGGDVYQNPEYSYVTHTMQPAMEMGEEAFRMVLRDEDDQTRKQHVLIKPKFIIGETCGANSKGV